MSDNLISRKAAIIQLSHNKIGNDDCDVIIQRDIETIKQLPSAEPKTGKWILDRSGAYCCSECMEPCAGYVMMKPRDKYCKMCGAKMEATE